MGTQGLTTVCYPYILVPPGAASPFDIDVPKLIHLLTRSYSGVPVRSIIAKNLASSKKKKLKTKIVFPYFMKIYVCVYA